ncbi:hypothetical protein HPB49_014920 [Dermacentor silvarum]|uniref:Uncharacterized protein n=1 Tax=Dermacentor silvarum TaxID=543639 RepID=A0ACB8DJG0_DERSI|nr:hypothetical protein HPB49_014920 [Dermacentor silvarum]
MATPDPKILAQRDTRPHGQAGRSGAPTPHSPIDGPSPETLSPSPPPVRVHVLGALPSQRDPARPSRDQRDHRYPDGARHTQPQDERLCIMLWVVGASLTFPLVLSAWLVLVPYLVHANWTTLVSPPPLSVSSEFLSTTAIPATSTSPWQDVPSQCLAPVMLSALPPRLNVSAPYSFGPSNESSRPIFCLFNNTRVYGGPESSTRWNYVITALPFALCPYVVYWSVGIENGNLKSRQPSFDEQYGLHRLRAIADALNFTTVKLLLALGGYPDDAPHFSRLGRDHATMVRLMNNLADSLERFGLNGITVHWIEARAGCHGPDDARVLNRLLRSLRETLNARKPSGGALVTVMLELNAPSQFVARETADIVDHFFLATQNERRSSRLHINQFCESGTAVMHDAYRRFVSALAATKLRRSQVCLTDSLMPFRVNVALQQNLSLKYASKTLTRVPLYPECNKDGMCEYTEPGSSCHYNLFLVKGPSHPYLGHMFLIDDVSTLQKRLDFTEINVTQLASAPGDPPHACILLLDLDGDIYADQCGGHLSRYALMRNYYYGTLGKLLRGDGDVHGTYATCKLHAR